MRAASLGCFVVLLVACGPAPGDPDGGDVDAATEVDGDASDVDASGVDAGDPCTGEEGRYECGGLARQCCGGQWHYFVDGPCLVRDGGGADAGPTDCTATPLTAGCPCTDEGATQCVSFSPSLHCESGVWTEHLRVACCSF